MSLYRAVGVRAAAPSSITFSAGDAAGAAAFARKWSETTGMLVLGLKFKGKSRFTQGGKLKGEKK